MSRYKNLFQELSDGVLIEKFNKEVGNRGWGSARADYMFDLRNELESRFDCSSIINRNAMSLANKVELDGKKIVLLK